MIATAVSPEVVTDVPARRLPLAGSFAFTSPYTGSWAQHFYAKHHHDFFGGKVIREFDFREKLAACEHVPEIIFMGNFIMERAGILSVCREYGINTVHCEDGFFPHYSTLHLDPLGFCWESSLPTLTFRECSAKQRQRASVAREEWLNFRSQPLPDAIRPPFVFWPLQLIGDRVNAHDLNLKDWSGLLRHFRASLPAEFQLVVKEHPRSRAKDNEGIGELVRALPNTVQIPKDTHLKSLLRECSGVAGANSSVLYEARLMFHKPAYAYARGWFTNHPELFMPVAKHDFQPRPLNRLDWLEDNRRMRTERLDDYADWFLAQLLARQVSHEEAQHNPDAFRLMVFRLSYHSYLEHDEDIFEPA